MQDRFSPLQVNAVSCLGWRSRWLNVRAEQAGSGQRQPTAHVDGSPAVSGAAAGRGPPLALAPSATAGESTDVLPDKAGDGRADILIFQAQHFQDRVIYSAKQNL